MAYQQRRYRGPLEALAQDIATNRVRAVIRTEIWLLLVQIGLVAGPPPDRQKTPALPRTGELTHLRLVTDRDRGSGSELKD
jgi:hypothetical protein